MKQHAFALWVVVCAQQMNGALGFKTMLRNGVSTITGAGFSQQPSGAAPAPATVASHFWYNNVTHVSQYEVPESDLGVFDEIAKHMYWVVTVGGVKTSTWTKPSEVDWRVMYDAKSKVPYFRNDALDLTTWDRPACLGWSKRDSEKPFFYNSVTNEAAWPHEVPEYVPFEDDKGQKFWHDKKTQISSYEPPSEEAAWLAAESSDHPDAFGKLATYFYNAKNKLSTWELPARSGLAWKKSYMEVEL
jgi:hypothetical protein